MTGVQKYETASLLRRVIGLAIDWLVSIVIAYGFFHYEGWIILAIFFVMTTILVGLLGASIGHIIVGIGVRRMDGDIPGFFRALGRQLLLCLVLPGIFTVPDGRSYSDALVGTQILKLR